jgi:hypothetical protein
MTNTVAASSTDWICSAASASGQLPSVIVAETKNATLLRQ